MRHAPTPIGYSRSFLRASDVVASLGGRDARARAPSSARIQWGESPHQTGASRSVTERNCGPARARGEQQEVKDQAVGRRT